MANGRAMADGMSWTARIGLAGVVFLDFKADCKSDPNDATRRGGR